jgi:GTPase SAR1 family protein
VSLSSPTDSPVLRPTVLDLPAVSRLHRPLRLELVGPAGAGKSTLAVSLVRQLQGAPREIWGLPALPLLLNGTQLIPTFTGLWLHSRSPLWHETRHMVRLRTLQRALRRPAPNSNEVLVFDEGPVFALAWLRGFGHAALRQQASAEWWRRALRDWASLVDAVVVLDAPDHLLAARIRARPHPHEVKEYPDGEIIQWMARFRQALEWVLTEMAGHGGPAVVRLSSQDEPADRIAEKVVSQLGRVLHAR